MKILKRQGYLITKKNIQYKQYPRDQSRYATHLIMTYLEIWEVHTEVVAVVVVVVVVVIVPEEVWATNEVTGGLVVTEVLDVDVVGAAVVAG